jgi:glutamate N-acetyltransferase/amino-acid N-acetyltransferase
VKPFSFHPIGGSVTAPQGFRAAGVFCDIKRLGTGKGSNQGRKRDLALIVSDAPAAVAGTFTTNQVCAAPVKVCIERVKRGTARAVVMNSGNANACTGRQGMEDAREMVRFTERALNLPAGSVLAGSTGRIGVALPMDNIRAGILEAAVGLGSTARHADQAAEAIMTSDTRPKQIAVRFRLGGKEVRITTDAAIEARTLQAALREATAQSFNRITVDGDTSTNDTVLVLANGLAGNKRFQILNSKFQIFQAALNHVCLELAGMIVRDGEGVSRCVTVRVHGAKSAADADGAARAVANSALVKTSWHGGDPNWGRIIDALGYSPATVVEEKVDVGYSAPGGGRILWSLRRGQPTRATFRQLCAAVAEKEFDLHVRLNLGNAGAVIYAADLTAEYVEFNKGDVTDPGSLGG